MHGIFHAALGAQHPRGSMSAHRSCPGLQTLSEGEAVLCSGGSHWRVAQALWCQQVTAQCHRGWCMVRARTSWSLHREPGLGLCVQQPPRTPAQAFHEHWEPLIWDSWRQRDASVRMHLQQAKHAEPIPQEPVQQGGWAVHRGCTRAEGPYPAHLLPHSPPTLLPSLSFPSVHVS